jgi:hypothetical protein
MHHRTPEGSMHLGQTASAAGAGFSMRGEPAPGLPRVSSGALLFGGDWAIAHGDADGLAHVLRDLADCLGGGLGHRLQALSQLCFDCYADAAARWPSLKAEARAQLAERAPPERTEPR